MPHCAVNSTGRTLLYYEDTGAHPESVDYVTVFLVHGTMFSSAIFRQMIPFATHNTLRLVLINCRDYPGSTLYSATELEALSSTDPEKQALSLQARGLEFIEFIRQFIETENIPPLVKNSDGTNRSGGFSLLGWSSGNCQTIPVLAHADLAPENTKKLFDLYFRSYIAYDPSLPSTGEDHIPTIWTPFSDPTLTAAQRFNAFSEWVAYYFPPTDFDDSADINTPGVSEKLIARAAVDAPMHKADRMVNYHWTPTVHRMDLQTLRAVCHFEVMERSQKFYQMVEPAVYRANVRLAMLEGRPGAGLVWPAVRVVVVWCDMSNSDLLSGVMTLKARVKQAREQGMGRDVVFRKLEGANHFAQWDAPERFTSFLAEVV